MSWLTPTTAGNISEIRLLSTSQLSMLCRDGETVAHCAAFHGHVHALRCLHELVPATLSARTKEGATAAHHAAIEGQVGVLRCLYELVPATLSAVDNQGRTVVQYAAQMGHVSVLRCLFELVPATVRAVDNQGRTVAHHVCIVQPSRALLEEIRGTVSTESSLLRSLSIAAMISGNSSHACN